MTDRQYSRPVPETDDHNRCSVCNETIDLVLDKHVEVIFRRPTTDSALKYHHACWRRIFTINLDA